MQRPCNTTLQIIVERNRSRIHQSHIVTTCELQTHLRISNLVSDISLSPHRLHIASIIFVVEFSTQLHNILHVGNQVRTHIDGIHERWLCLVVPRRHRQHRLFLVVHIHPHPSRGMVIDRHTAIHIRTREAHANLQVLRTDNNRCVLVSVAHQVSPVFSTRQVNCQSHNTMLIWVLWSTGVHTHCLHRILTLANGIHQSIPFLV